MGSVTQSYSIRLAVVDDGKVKATMLDVGKTGEAAFNQIDKSAKKASITVSEVADKIKEELLVTLGEFSAELAAAFAVEKIYEFVKGVFESSEQLAKMADLLGINTESLQELRYAAKLAGIDQETFDKGIEKFSKNIGEAIYGTGKSTEAFKELGITLKDGEGNIRKTEDVLNDVADAFTRVEDPQDRLRLSYLLFDKAGLQFAEMLAQGSQHLNQVRQQAQDLGIVLEDSLVRQAERTTEEVTTLSKVVEINLSRALLSLAPLIGDAAKALTDFAVQAGIAYEKSKLFLSGDFEFKGLSKNNTEVLYNQYKAQVEDLQAKIKELGNPSITDDFWKWNEAFSLKAQLDDAQAEYEKYAARYEEIQQKIRDSDQQTKDNNAQNQQAKFNQLVQEQHAEEEHAKQLVSIEQKLQNDLFNISYQGAAKIEAERQRAKDELTSLLDKNPQNIQKINELIAQTDKLYDLKAAQAQAEQDQKDADAKQKVFEANEKIIESLQEQRDELGKTDREQAIDEALRRLSADATEAQRQKVKLLAGELYDERQAHEELRKEEEKRQQSIKKIQELYDQQGDVIEKYQKDLQEIYDLLKSGAITEQQAMVAMQDAQNRMLQNSKEWQAGVVRGLKTYSDSANNMAANLQTVVGNTFSNLEDALTNFTKTGKLNWSNMIDGMIDDVARLLVRTQITGPLAQALGAGIGSIFGFAHGGVFANGVNVQAFARGGVVNSPTIFPMANGMGLMGEAGPEAVMPLTRLPSGRLGVETAGSGNGSPTYVLNIDASGSSDPAATSAQVAKAIDQALNAKIPGIVKASSGIAQARVIDTWQRNGGRFA